MIRCLFKILVCLSLASCLQLESGRNDGGIIDPKDKAKRPPPASYAPISRTIPFDPDTGEWIPPIGIPRPSFGISEVAPARPHPWLAEVPGYYYVEETHPNATNTNNPYGTPVKPRLSIPGSDGDPLPAGSVVEVSGRYSKTHSSPGTFHGAGTRANPIFIRGRDAQTRAEFTNYFSVVGSTFVIVENIKFMDADGDLTEGKSGVFGVTDKNRLKYDSNHIVLRHCEVSGNVMRGGTAIANAAPTSVISNIVFYDNFIHDNGDVNADFDQDVHGVTLNGSVSNIWIVDNEMARNSGDGVQINGSAALHHVYVGRNTSHHNKQTGLWTKTASDVIFSQNTVYGHRGIGGIGAGMGFQYDPQNVWYIFNRSYNNDTGIAGQSGLSVGAKNVYLIGNLIHDIHLDAGSVGSGTGGWKNAAILLVGGPPRYVVNNTIYDVDAGINTPSSYPLYIYNNIIANLSDPAGAHVYIQYPGVWDMKNNLFYQPGESERVRIGGDYYDLPQTLATFGKGQNSISSDPLFKDADNGNVQLLDFSLNPASSAFRAGTPTEVYDLFQDRYGLSIAVDHTGKARPTNKAWSVGAFE